MENTDKVLSFDAGWDQNKVGDTVTLTYKDENIFMNNLPISKADYKRAKDAERDYLNAFAKVASEEATNVLKKDKGVEKVLVEVPYGDQKRSGATAKIHRMKEHRNPFGEGDATIKSSTFEMVVQDTAAKLSKNFIKELKQQQNEALGIK